MKTLIIDTSGNFLYTERIKNDYTKGRWYDIADNKFFSLDVHSGLLKRHIKIQEELWV